MLFSPITPDQTSTCFKLFTEKILYLLPKRLKATLGTLVWPAILQYSMLDVLERTCLVLATHSFGRASRVFTFSSTLTLLPQKSSSNFYIKDGGVYVDYTVLISRGKGGVLGVCK